jgi:hypothetical protein
VRCECCDKLLKDSEATARFVTAPSEPVRYVGMCATCQGFLPPEVKILTSSYEHDDNDDFEKEYFDDEEDDN